MTDEAPTRAGGTVTTDVLTIRELVVRYGSGVRAVTAVDSVSLAVPAGSTVGIVGESGCGKSTLAKALVGLVPVARGEILLDGVDHTGERARNSLRFRRAVQLVFQDPHASLDPRMTVGQCIAEAIGTRAGVSRSRQDRRREVERLLELVQIPKGSADRHPHAFSGGQKQRIAIARALATGARMIIHDEVTSALDVSVQAAILNLLKDLQRELGLSYIFISHDLAAVRAVSDSVVVMYLGRIVEKAPADGLFEHPAHPYTGALIASIPTLHQPRRPAQLAGEVPDPRNPASGCRFHTRCPVGPLLHNERTDCVSSDPSAGAQLRLHESACHYSPQVRRLATPSVDIADHSVTSTDSSSATLTTGTHPFT